MSICRGTGCDGAAVEARSGRPVEEAVGAGEVAEQGVTKALKMTKETAPFTK